MRPTQGASMVYIEQNGSSTVKLPPNGVSPRLAAGKKAMHAVSNTVTPDLSQKLIIFKEQLNENRKRTSLKNGSRESNNPYAKTIREKAGKLTNSNIPTSRVHSTLANYNNQLSYDQHEQPLTKFTSPNGHENVLPTYQGGLMAHHQPDNNYVPSNNDNMITVNASTKGLVVDNMQLQRASTHDGR